jgi:hypothetical protein
MLASQHGFCCVELISYGGIVYVAHGVRFVRSILWACYRMIVADMVNGFLV